MNGIDHLVLYGRARSGRLMLIREGQVEWRDAAPYVGLDNIDMRTRVAARSRRRVGAQHVDGQRDARGRARCSDRGHHGRAEGDLRARRHRREDGIAAAEGDRHAGPHARIRTAQPYKAYNRQIAQKLLGTSVVKHALSTMGTPFLYRPSRLLGAMGTKNNQETTWTDALDAEHIDPYRPGMEGCFRCPVNCRPMNELQPDPGDKYGRGDGPEYVTLGKFGPNLGIDRRRVGHSSQQHLQRSRPRHGIDRLGDRMGAGAVSSAASSRRAHTGGLELTWGDAAPSRSSCS